jgi:hypothetical protein
MPVPMVVAPADLFGLEVIDLVLPNHRGLRMISTRRHQALIRHDRRQRRGVRTCGKRTRACDYSKSEFQKVAALHGYSSLANGEPTGRFLLGRHEWSLNRIFARHGRAKARSASSR